MTPKRSVSKKLYRLAVKMETDGMAFYGDMAARVSSPMAKQLFKSLVKDEHKHLQVVQSIFEGVPLTNVSRRFRRGTPATRLKTAFEKVKASSRKRVSSQIDEIDALKMALNMERESYSIYHQEAQRVSSPEEKKILERLALEENEHFEILSNTLSYITDTGGWFIWKDHAVLDGG